MGPALKFGAKLGLAVLKPACHNSSCIAHKEGGMLRAGDDIVSRGRLMINQAYKAEDVRSSTMSNVVRRSVKAPLTEQHGAAPDIAKDQMTSAGEQALSANRLKVSTIRVAQRMSLHEALYRSQAKKQGPDGRECPAHLAAEHGVDGGALAGAGDAKHQHRDGERQQALRVRRLRRLRNVIITYLRRSVEAETISVARSSARSHPCRSRADGRLQHVVASACLREALCGDTLPGITNI